MRTVEDDAGDRYILLKESSESSLVRDPESGERRHIPTEELQRVAGESPLATAAGAVSGPVRALLTAIPDEQALGLLLELDQRGPMSVRALLEYDLCESDLHGLLAEFRAAELLVETEVAGERGYETTEQASEGLARLH